MCALVTVVQTCALPIWVQRDLDDNEDAQRRSQREQDGSEVRSVELERLIAQGLTLLERRNAFEFLRDHAAELFEGHTGLAWKPLSGSKRSEERSVGKGCVSTGRSRRSA